MTSLKALLKDILKKYSNLVLSAENVMGAIGYFMKESGIEAILAESKV